MVRQRDRRPDKWFPSSRDWMVEEIPCTCSDCPSNNGREKCVMPSAISINAAGVCIQAFRTHLDKKNNPEMWPKEK
jgi:predicted metal-binding protein